MGGFITKIIIAKLLKTLQCACAYEPQSAKLSLRTDEQLLRPHSALFDRDLVFLVYIVTIVSLLLCVCVSFGQPHRV